MAHLISKRAASRKVGHFTQNDLGNAPPGFTPHPKPLFLNYGVPNDGFFPVESLKVTTVDYPFQKSLAIPVTNGSLENLSLDHESKNTITIPRHTEDPRVLDLARGLQYSEVKGTAPLLKFVKDFVKRVHSPADPDWDAIVTNGAGDGLNKAADALFDEGDVCLIEEFTFTPFLQGVTERGAIPVPIKLDLSSKSEGIDLEYLTDLLENWSSLRPGLKSPKALYTIATGQNPIGTTQTLEFRKKIYALAEKYDFAIIEDDPYGYLKLDPYRKPDKYVQLNQFLSVDEFIKDHLTPSYINIDTSGRVIRIETFSKLFGPGLRLGFIVANKKVVEAIHNYATLVTRFSSGTSQTLFTNVVYQSFGGVDGWIQWILKVGHTYGHRKNILLQSLYESKAYEKKYIEVIDPKAGMFATVLLNFPEGTDVPAKLNLLNFKFVQHGVNVVLGIKMVVDKEFSKDTAKFVRLSFAPSGNDADLAEAGRRIAQAVQEFFENGLEF